MNLATALPALVRASIRRVHISPSGENLNTKRISASVLAPKASRAPLGSPRKATPEHKSKSLVAIVRSECDHPPLGRRVLSMLAAVDSRSLTYALSLGPMRDSTADAVSLDSMISATGLGSIPNIWRTWSGRFAWSPPTRGKDIQRNSIEQSAVNKESPLQSPPGGLHIPSKTSRSEPRRPNSRWRAVSTSCSP